MRRASKYDSVKEDVKVWGMCRGGSDITSPYSCSLPSTTRELSTASKEKYQLKDRKHYTKIFLKRYDKRGKNVKCWSMFWLPFTWVIFLLLCNWLLPLYGSKCNTYENNRTLTFWGRVLRNSFLYIYVFLLRFTRFAIWYEWRTQFHPFCLPSCGCAGR